MEGAAPFREEFGNSAIAEGAKGHRRGHQAVLFCQAPVGGDTPLATGVSPWERGARLLNRAPAGGGTPIPPRGRSAVLISDDGCSPTQAGGLLDKRIDARIRQRIYEMED